MSMFNAVSQWCYFFCMVQPFCYLYIYIILLFYIYKMLFKKVLLEFLFSYQTCSALFSQKKKIKFWLLYICKTFWSSKWLRWKKKKKRKKIKVLCTFHFVGCSLPVSPFLIYSTGWLLVATGSMIDPRLFLPDCLTVSKLRPLGLGLGLK